MEHCTECHGERTVTRDDKQVTCLHCAGTGIEPTAKRVGPFGSYAGMRRDAVILVGLIVFLFLLNAFN